MPRSPRGFIGIAFQLQIAQVVPSKVLVAMKRNESTLTDAFSRSQSDLLAWVGDHIHIAV
jgi:hypothetical protein